MSPVTPTDLRRSKTLLAGLPNKTFLQRCVASRKPQHQSHLGVISDIAVVAGADVARILFVERRPGLAERVDRLAAASVQKSRPTSCSLDGVMGVHPLQLGCQAARLWLPSDAATHRFSEPARYPQAMDTQSLRGHARQRLTFGHDGSKRLRQLQHDSTAAQPRRLDPSSKHRLGPSLLGFGWVVYLLCSWRT